MMAGIMLPQITSRMLPLQALNITKEMKNK
jgi:hypothetical protein